MTGRGRGYCNPRGMGAYSPMPRFGWRRFAGCGYGWRGMGFEDVAMPTIEEKRALLERQLEVIKANLAALDRVTDESGE